MTFFFRFPGSTSASSSPLGNAILPPEDFSPSASVSPLQRMASITNSLISQPPTPHHHAPSQRPMKAVLPPITQQQFDQFNNLNTEEIVRKVSIMSTFSNLFNFLVHYGIGKNTRERVHVAWGRFTWEKCTHLNFYLNSQLKFLRIK